MNKRVIWIAAIGGMILLGAWWFGGTTYHYKLTVEVETPQGLRTGYAVREVRWSKGMNITPEATTSSMTHEGEAAMVDLPGNQTLFALMSPDGQETPMLAFGSARQSRWSDRSAKVLAPNTKPESGYPRLVRFRDTRDPASVEEVDPADLAAIFGPGYRLKRITAQIVDDPITEAVEKRLPWLANMKDRMLDGERYHQVQSQDLASHLNVLAFRRVGI